MTKNHVEAFTGYGTPVELEFAINEFCKCYHYSPISMSVVLEEGTYTAFVVVEECGGADNGE